MKYMITRLQFSNLLYSQNNDDVGNDTYVLTGECCLFRLSFSVLLVCLLRLLFVCFRHQDVFPVYHLYMYIIHGKGKRLSLTALTSCQLLCAARGDNFFFLLYFY